MHNLNTYNSNIVSHSVSNENPIKSHEDGVNSPKWQHLLTERGILEVALDAGWTPIKHRQHDGWQFPTSSLDGTIKSSRWKAFPDQAGGSKYAWKGGKHDGCDYYLPPNSDLTEAIQANDGHLYLASGEPDVLVYMSAGIHNVTCWFGETSVPKTLAEDLCSLGVKQVTYFPDRDSTGLASAVKLAGQLRNASVEFNAYHLPNELGEKGDINKLWIGCNFDKAQFLDRLATLAVPSNVIDFNSNGAMQSTFSVTRGVLPHSKSTKDNINWNEERTLWITTEILPKLDQVAPIIRREGSRERRHCPSPHHHDNNPSFAISYDRASDHGIPQCSCNIQDEDAPWEKVAEWVGTRSFMDWWRLERKQTINHTSKRKVNNGGSSNMQAIPEVPVEEEEVEEEEEVVELSTDNIASEILCNHYFAKDNGDKMYHYSDGVYKAGGEKKIRELVKDQLIKWGLSNKWTKHRSNEVIEYIKVDVPQLWERPPLDVINLKNGLLNLETMFLRPHAPDYLSTTQLPVAYDPEAVPTYWNQFCESTFPTDAYEAGVHWQIAAWLITPYTSLSKALLLYGDGGNGKSCFIRGLTALIGNSNITRMPLQTLETQRFAPARLRGKLANICPDLPNKHLEQTSIFKQLTGDDGYIAGEYKYGDHFEFEPFARLVFSANQLPRSSDRSDGFYRRWLIIPFNRVFKGQAAQNSSEINKHLSRPQELSGVLNMALKYLRQVHAEGITETPSIAGTLTAFRQKTDPFEVWLDQETIMEPNAKVSIDELVKVYNITARHNGWEILTNALFGHLLRDHRPNVSKKQRKWNDIPKTWVYIGIGLKHEQSEK